MATVKQIFDYIQGMNPSTSTVSSIGTFVTELSQQVADNIVREVIENLPEGTLAYKIATSTTGRFSEKQLWVIAYELEKNKEFSAKVANHYAELERKSNAKIAASKEKKAANKAASADVLAPIVAAKKVTAFGQWLNTAGNPYRSQHFSKKYTQEAVNAFLQTL